MRSGLPAFLACCYGLLSLAPSDVLGQNPSPPEIEPRPPLLVAGLWRPGTVELEPEEKPEAQGRSVILSQILTLSPQISLEESTVIRFVDDLPLISQSPGRQARGFTLSRVGPPGDTDAILAQRKIEIKTVTTRANRFWSPVSSSAKGGAATTEHRIAFGPVVTAFCEPLPATDSAEATASAVDGAVFRARGVPLLFRVSNARFAAGGRLTWTEASGAKRRGLWTREWA